VAATSAVVEVVMVVADEAAVADVAVGIKDPTR
jgi:hypothetical protein